MRSLSGLRYWRLRAQFSQRELADALHVSPQTVSEWERGHARPRFEHTRQLLQVLGVPSLEALFDHLPADKNGAPV